MRDEDHSSFDEIAERQREDSGRIPTDRGRRRADHHGRGFLGRLLPVLLVLVVVVGLGAGGVYGYRWVTSNVSVGESEPSDYPGPGSGEAVIQVKQGDSGTDIAKTLVEADVIKSTGPFVSLFSNSPEAGKISPGSYRLKKKMSAEEALDALLDPDNLAGARVTIPEGLRMSDIFERLSQATGVPVKDFEKAAKDYTSLGVPKNPAKSAEGYLWPGRYDFPEDADARSMLTAMVKRMDHELDSRHVPKKERHRLLTIASIAEKETASPEDFGKVARTIDNRLAGVGEAKGHPMKLQLDSTVAYVTGKREVSTTPKDRKIDSPYNTYRYEGLPLGPISNPGAASIDAALHPPKGKWLYWVTVDTKTGETKFATTKAQHDKNVAEWNRRSGN